MTDDIGAMPAGPELDRLVAEEVMGWAYEPECGLMEGELFKEIDGPWQPSRDIAHAWEVVEQVGLLVCSGAVRVKYCGDGDVWFAVDAPPCIARGSGVLVYTAGLRKTYAYEGDGWSCRAWATGDTAPLAICRAALMCVRGGK